VNKILQQLGEPGPEVGFVDLGANIGVFTLAAAAAGHHVISIDPMINNIARMNRSLELADNHHKVTVVQTALSDSRGEMFMKVRHKNKGGSLLVPKDGCHSDSEFICYNNDPVPVITIDDLLPKIPFKNIVMKVDIEGYEHKAFKSAERLLKDKSIMFIHMEFQMLRKLISEEDVREVNDFISQMLKSGFAPFSDTGLPLETVPWRNWSADIVWKNKNKG